MTTANEVVAYARTWLGTRWIHQGRTRQGIDCAGLLIMTINHFEDMEGDDLLGYRRDPSKTFLQHMKRETLPVRPMRPVNGAIAILHDTNMPCHVGIFAVCSKTGAVTVIHAEAFPARRVHEEFYDKGNEPLSSRLVDIRYFRGVDYVE